MPSRRQGPGKHLTREGQIFLSLVPAERNSLPHYPRFGMQRSSPALLLPSGNHRAGNPIRNNYPDNAPSPHALYFLFTLYLHIVHNNMCSHVSGILLHASRGPGTRGSWYEETLYEDKPFYITKNAISWTSGRKRRILAAGQPSACMTHPYACRQRAVVSALLPAMAGTASPGGPPLRICSSLPCSTTPCCTPK